MAIRIFVTRSCDRQARRSAVSDQLLLEAILRAEEGLVDAKLGRLLIKQRIARQGQGRSGGYRTIIIYRRGDLAVFLSVFAKSEQDNVSPKELLELQQIAEAFSVLSPTEINQFVAEGKWRPLNVFH